MYQNRAPALRSSSRRSGVAYHRRPAVAPKNCQKPGRGDEVNEVDQDREPDPLSPAATEPRVGFVGLGRLGLPVALRILGDGLPLTAWVRHQGAFDPLLATAARRAATLEELGASSDVVCICVTDEPDVLEVLQGGLLQGMSPGALLVIHSTVPPRACERFGVMGASAGVRVVDAPLCGGPYSAQRGLLPIPVGGDPADYDRCLPVLRSYGSLIRLCGPLGSGQRMKLIFNLLYAASTEIVFDAFQTGVEAGVQPDVLTEFLTSFPYHGFVGASLATGRSPAGNIRHTRRLLAKDIGYAMEMLEQAGQDGGEIARLASAALTSLDVFGDRAG